MKKLKYFFACAIVLVAVAISTIVFAEYKEQKVKGEVVQSWYRVTLNRVFQEEKEPDSTISVDYSRSFGSFPTVARDDEEDED